MHTTTTMDSLSAAASSALSTGQEYLSSAAAAVQPHVEKARTMVAGSMGGPRQTASQTAPLESGPHVVDNPYPETKPSHVGEI